MKNENKNLLVALLLVLSALLLTNCSAPVKRWDHNGKKYTEIGVRANLDYIQWTFDIGDAIQTTGVHPDDAGFLTGTTTTDLDGEDGLLPRVGLMASIGTNKMRVTCGTDLRFCLAGDDYQKGWYDTRQHSSDQRPPSGGSFVFTQLTPDLLSMMPYVALEVWLHEKVILGIEAGFPYTGFEARSGHDRFGSWKTVQKDDWSGFGTRFAGTAGYKYDDNLLISLGAFQESYQAEFVGEDADIKGGGGFIEFRYDF